MTEPKGDGEGLLDVRHRDLRIATTLVIVALAGGLALLWPAVQERVIARFGPFFPSRFLLGELLVLVALFVVHVWRKAGHIERLVARLLDERDRREALTVRLTQARAVLEASAQLQLDQDASASLKRILECVTEGLGAQRGVLWRLRGEGRPLEREALFPSSAAPPDPLVHALEDEIARKVAASGERMILGPDADLRALGIAAARPRTGPSCMVAAPLVLDGKPVGALLLAEPRAVAADDGAALELLDVFAGFAAGVLRNLRLFQVIARRNEELMRARQLLCDHQRELAEIDAVATMSCVAKSLAHGLSGPLTAINGFVDVVMTAPPQGLTLQAARDGLRREIGELKVRLQRVVDFTQTWRREYGVVDLNQMVETAVALHAEPLRMRGIGSRFEPHVGLPFTVADPTRLRQAFLSLLTFLRGALREGQGREVRVRTLPDGCNLRVQFDFPGRADLAALCGPLQDPNVDVQLLGKENHVELPVALAILRDHRGQLELGLRDDGTTRMEVILPILDAAPEQVRAAPATHETLDQVLARIFGDEPVPARAAEPPHEARHEAPREPQRAPPAVRTPPAAAPVAIALEPASAPPPQPERPAEPAHLATSRPPSLVPRGANAAEGSGLEALFGPGDLFQGGVPRTAPRRPANAPPRRSLVDQAELEGCLSLFDREEKPPRKE